MRCSQRWAVLWNGSALLFTLLVSSPARSQETGAQPGAEPNAPTEVSPPADRLTGWRHAVSPAWHMATFWSREDSHYTFHSLSIGYLMSVNASGPFVHLSWVIPLQARQDGRVHAVSDLYQNSGGIDLLLGWQWRIAWGSAAELELGPGVHMDALNLGGRPGLTNFNAIQLGLGGMTILRWRPSWQPGKVGWSVGGVLALALDAYDPLRSNDLKLGVTTRLGAILGVDLP